MNDKKLLVTGIIITIASIASLIGYWLMEMRMPKFRSNSFWSWILLCIGIGMVSYLVGKNQKK